MTPRRADESGFTLLEALVAFVIAALALGVLFHGLIGGLRTTAIAGSYEQAVARARSRLAAIGGRASPLVPGVRTGDDGSGFTWRTQIMPTGTAALPATQPGLPAPQLVLYRVSVTVSWHGDGGLRQVQLVTARAAPATQSGGP